LQIALVLVVLLEVSSIKTEDDPRKRAFSPTFRLCFQPPESCFLDSPLVLGSISRMVFRFLFLIGLILYSISLSSAAEFRAAWVASVYNFNFPSKAGLPAEAQKAQIRRIVSGASAVGLNALMVQVRPEGDALYQSRIEPWSRFLSGSQGTSPGYDPLDYFIQEGRKRGIAIHAWINPYRAATNVSEARASNHVSRRLSGHVRRIGSMLWLDPGEPEVRQHVVSVVRDIVERYPVAGVIIDDYFYPYPSRSYAKGSFPDNKSYAKYGGGTNLGDWRRKNVNLLVRDLNKAVKNARPNVLFGVSPFGTYTKGSPSDVTIELDQYRDLYADPVTWLNYGWVDYLAPQLYWRDKSPQSFSTLLRWWRSSAVNPRGIPIYPSIALVRLGSSHNWPASEIATQLGIESEIHPRTSGGFLLWNIGPLLENKKGVVAVVARGSQITLED